MTHVTAAFIDRVNKERAKEAAKRFSRIRGELAAGSTLSKIDNRWIYKRLSLTTELTDAQLLEWVEAYIAHKTTQRLTR